jgi:hypothetical protein
MTDTIRAALDAAVRAYCCADAECPCGHYSECLIAPNPDTRDGMAKAIAAFLRQMDPVACGDGFTFASLADAVERAGGAHGWKCPINSPGCTRNCGNYGCGN